MSSSSSNLPIGGYFELELRSGEPLHHDVIALNTARNSFEYILKTQKPTKIFLPKYTCDVMLEPLKKLNISYEMYSIDQNLEIFNIPELKQNELLLYTNYFGVKNTYTSVLSRRFSNKLIVDCSQAFYFKPTDGAHGIYSPRKFFGVPDGGYVFTNKSLDEDLDADISYLRMQHLLRRIDQGPEDGFKDFKKNDDSLAHQPIKQMSLLTQKLLANIDYKDIRTRRLSNFNYLHTRLRSQNRIILDKSIDAPMVYPFLVENGNLLKNKLIQSKIFIPTYWPNIFEWCRNDEFEYYLASNMLALPVDQRYNEEDMSRIIECIQ